MLIWIARSSVTHSLIFLCSGSHLKRKSRTVGYNSHHLKIHSTSVVTWDIWRDKGVLQYPQCRKTSFPFVNCSYTARRLPVTDLKAEVKSSVKVPLSTARNIFIGSQPTSPLFHNESPSKLLLQKNKGQQQQGGVCLWSTTFQTRGPFAIGLDSLHDVNQASSCTSRQQAQTQGRP